MAREVRDTDANVRAAIVARFGVTDAASLATIVFRDPRALADLEAIVHPAVRDRVRDRLEAQAMAGTRVTAVEAIKLLESPLRDRCDVVWVVVCRPEDAIQRLAGRGMSPTEVRRRMANQMPAEQMVDAADVVIDGSAEPADTLRQVERALAALEQPSEPGAIGG